MRFNTTTQCMELCGICCVCVMPSGTERFHHNVTPAAAEREVNTQGRGTQGRVCARVYVCMKGTTAAAPADLQSGGEWLSLREGERDQKAIQ